MKRPLDVRLAAGHEAAAVVALLNDASQWLQQRGIDQWPYPYPPELVEASIARGETYLAFIDGRAVASIALWSDDPRFWGERPPDALYVHRLVVARNAVGSRIGEALLDWAGRHTRAVGREWLRLDCGADNTRIRTFYEALGFVHRGDTEVHITGAGATDAPWKASLYERMA